MKTKRKTKAIGQTKLFLLVLSFPFSLSYSHTQSDRHTHIHTNYQPTLTGTYTHTHTNSHYLSHSYTHLFTLSHQLPLFHTHIHRHPHPHTYTKSLHCFVCCGQLVGLLKRHLVSSSLSLGEDGSESVEQPFRCSQTDVYPKCKRSPKLFKEKPILPTVIVKSSFS